jgi:hypothetical protein
MSYTAGTEVDLSAYPTAHKLVARCREFLAEVENLTPGSGLEARLNATYGPGHAFYEDFCTYIRRGLADSEDWISGPSTEIDGSSYRRSKISLPCAENRFFSITAVYMDSSRKDQAQGSDEVFSGQYHQHPYGEINCVIPIDASAELKGMQGWQGAGWTSPGPGTHHYPQVRGGALVALFFLPAGRISYEAKPGMPQPVSL